MEKVCRFPLLRLKPSDTPPPSSSRESGDPEAGERENKGETQEKRAIKRNAPDLDSRFRGNDKRESVFWLQCAKLIKSHPQILSKNQSFFLRPMFGSQEIQNQVGCCGHEIFFSEGRSRGKGALEFYDQTGQTRLVARARFGVIGVFAETASRRVLTCRGKSALVAFVASRFPAGKPEGPGRLRKRDRTRFGLEGAWFSAPTRTRF
jgi:hypothetical protein